MRLKIENGSAALLAWLGEKYVPPISGESVLLLGFFCRMTRDFSRKFSFRVVTLGIFPHNFSEVELEEDQGP